MATNEVEADLEILGYPGASFRVVTWNDGRWGIEATVSVTDVVTGGAKEVSRAMTVQGDDYTAVAVAAFKAVLRCVLHETAEWFTVAGVRVFCEHLNPGDPNGLTDVDVAIIETNRIGADAGSATKVAPEDKPYKFLTDPNGATDGTE